MSWLSSLGSTSAGAGAAAAGAAKAASYLKGAGGAAGSALSQVPKATFASMSGGTGALGALEQGVNSGLIQAPGHMLDWGGPQQSMMGTSFEDMITKAPDAKSQQPHADKILGLLGLGFDNTHLKMQQQAENSVPNLLALAGMA